MFNRKGYNKVHHLKDDIQTIDLEILNGLDYTTVKQMVVEIVKRANGMGVHIESRLIYNENSGKFEIYFIREP